MQNKLFKRGVDSILLIVATTDCLKDWIKTGYAIPQTAIAGLLYGLLHNENSADAASINHKLRKMYDRYELAHSIRRLQKSIESFNNTEFIPETLAKNLIAGDFSNLKSKLLSQIASSDDVAKANIQAQIRAIEKLEQLPQNMTSIVADIIRKNGTINVQDLTQSFTVQNLSEEAKKLGLERKLKELMHNKKSINISDMDLLLSLMKQNPEQPLPLPSSKELNKVIFKAGQMLGSGIRSLLTVKALDKYYALNIFLGIIALCLVLLIYIIFFLMKILQSISIGVLDLVKMFFLGVCASLVREEDKTNIFLIDFKKFLVEITATYKCLFESASKDVDSESFHNKIGRQSIQKVLEKLIYELWTKISVNYSKLSAVNKSGKTWIEEVVGLYRAFDQQNKTLKELFKTHNMTPEEQKAFRDNGHLPERLKTNEELTKAKTELDDASQKLHDKFEEKMCKKDTQSIIEDNTEIPFFTIATFFQHLHTAFETGEIMLKRSTFTAAKNFTDYVTRREDHSYDSGPAFT